MVTWPPFGVLVVSSGCTAAMPNRLRPTGSALISSSVMFELFSMVAIGVGTTPSTFTVSVTPAGASTAFTPTWPPRETTAVWATSSNPSRRKTTLYSPGGRPISS